jgi:hypothetical protein
MASVAVLRPWIFFLNFKGTPSGLCKNFFPPLQPKLLVMWERIGEALQFVCEMLKLTSFLPDFSDGIKVE